VLTTVRLDGSEAIDAWVYIAVQDRCSVTPVRPRREYMRLLVNAARQHALPNWYVAELAATPTVD
jgi:hypothetical protein